MTYDSSLLHASHPPYRNQNIHATNDTPQPVITVGSISPKISSLSTVLCVPNLSINLISVSELTSFGYIVSFTSIGCSIQDIHIRKQLSSLATYAITNLNFHHSHFCSNTFSLWYSRLGQFSLNKLKFSHSDCSL